MEREVVTVFVLRLIAVLSGFLTLVTITYLLSDTAEEVSVISLATIPVFILSCFGLSSRNGLSKLKLIPAFLIGLFYFFGFITTLHWGFDAPQGVLTLALAGILLALLFKGSVVVVVFLGSILLYVAIACIQVLSVIQVSNSWKELSWNFTDISVYSVTLAIIFYVTWLFHQRLNKSLLDTRASERRYKELSENLNKLVIKRTRALREENIRRLSEVHQFVLYGKEVSGLIHDLINPLTVLSLQVQNLQKTTTQSSEFINLQKSVNRLEEFVVGTRNRMRNEVVQEKVDVMKEVIEAVASLKQRMNKSEIRVKIVGRKMWINTDRNALYKTLINIISNALDSFEDSLKTEKLVNIRLSSDSAQCKVLITDNGCGIRTRDMRKIFTPFFTTKNTQQNTGIGLALVQQLVIENLKGKISIKSDFGKGTLVEIQIPLTQSTEY